LVDAVVEVLRAILLVALSTLFSHVFTWYSFASYERCFPTKGSLRREISQAWGRSFDEWNYPCD
jgi:hypothetical protein